MLGNVGETQTTLHLAKIRFCVVSFKLKPLYLFTHWVIYKAWCKIWDISESINKMPWRIIGSVGVRFPYTLGFGTASRYLLFQNMIAMFLASAGRGRMQGIWGLIHVPAFPQSHKSLQSKQFCQYGFNSQSCIYPLPNPLPPKDTFFFVSELLCFNTYRTPTKRKSVKVSAIPLTLQCHCPTFTSMRRQAQTDKQMDTLPGCW